MLEGNVLRHGGAEGELRHGGAEGELRHGGAEGELRHGGAEGELRHGGAEGELRHGGTECEGDTEGDTKLACCKAMCLGMRVLKVSLGKRVPKVKGY
ncbi:hypothetical protein ACE6H2_010999 [Prunus campanulata]